MIEPILIGGKEVLGRGPTLFSQNPANGESKVKYSTASYLDLDDAINAANAKKAAAAREAKKPSPDVIAARKRQYSGKNYTTADKKTVIQSYKEETEVDHFDLIKNHFVEEGYSEMVAYTKMLNLTDQDKQDILDQLK